MLDLVNKYSGMRAVYNFEDIIGESKEIKKVITYAKGISSSPSTVLIEGESGTGKNYWHNQFTIMVIEEKTVLLL